MKKPGEGEGILIVFRGWQGESGQTAGGFCWFLRAADAAGGGGPCPYVMGWRPISQGKSEYYRIVKTRGSRPVPQPNHKDNDGI